MENWKQETENEQPATDRETAPTVMTESDDTFLGELPGPSSYGPSTGSPN